MRRNRTATPPRHGSPATADAARRPVPRPTPRRSPDRASPASRSVAEVTSRPCAGAASVAANGIVGSSQWRCRPTSISRPLPPVQPQEQHMVGTRCPGSGCSLGQALQHGLPRLTAAPARGGSATGRSPRCGCGSPRPYPRPRHPGGRAAVRAAWRAVRRSGPARGPAGRRLAATPRTSGNTSHSSAPKRPALGSRGRAPAPGGGSGAGTPRTGWAGRRRRPPSSGPSSC